MMMNHQQNINSDHSGSLFPLPSVPVSPYPMSSSPLPLQNLSQQLIASASTSTSSNAGNSVTVAAAAAAAAATAAATAAAAAAAALKHRKPSKNPLTHPPGVVLCSGSFFHGPDGTLDRVTSLRLRRANAAMAAAAVAAEAAAMAQAGEAAVMLESVIEGVDGQVESGGKETFGGEKGGAGGTEQSGPSILRSESLKEDLSFGRKGRGFITNHLEFKDDRKKGNCSSDAMLEVKKILDSSGRTPISNKISSSHNNNNNDNDSDNNNIINSNNSQLDISKKEASRSSHKQSNKIIDGKATPDVERRIGRRSAYAHLSQIGEDGDNRRRREETGEEEGKEEEEEEEDGGFQKKQESPVRVSRKCWQEPECTKWIRNSKGFQSVRERYLEVPTHQMSHDESRLRVANCVPKRKWRALGRTSGL